MLPSKERYSAAYLKDTPMEGCHRRLSFTCLTMRMLRSLIHVLLMNTVGHSVTIWRICVTVLDSIPPP